MDPPPRPPARTSGLVLPLAFGLAVLLARVPVLLAHQDTWYPFEVHSGTIACALLDGLDVDVGALPIISHARGSVLFGVLLAPLYALLGASSITMKLLPVAWHAATVALLVGLLGRTFARRAAWCAGVLLLLAPPMLVKLSTVGLASHLESMLPVLLAFAAFLAWTARGPSRARAFGFGTALGFCGFFHLQALLPGLLLLGLLAVHELRARRPPRAAEVAAFAIGAALLALPSFLFDGGGVSLLLSGVFTTSAPSAAAEAAADGRLAKAAGLLTGDLATALEFGDTPAPLGEWLGTLAVVGLGLGTVVGLTSLPRGGPGAWFFPLHAAMVLGLYTVSELTVVPDVGTGAAHRHLAPMVFALLAFTAVGAAHRRAALVPVALLALAGGVALPAVVATDAAARTSQRGECYEWFTRHLHRTTGGDPQTAARLLERIDRGDPRFRSLRFRLNVPGIAREAGRRLGGGRGSGTDAPPPPDLADLLVWTAIGRFLSAPDERGSLLAVTRGGRLDRLSPVAREALLHGVGLGLEAPRAVFGLERVRGFVGRLSQLLRALPGDAARAVAEGYGVQLGLVLDPYNPRLAEVLDAHRGLDPRLGEAFARGVAWGVRQRYRAPPAAVPEGLDVVLHLDPRVRPAFEAAFAGRVLPHEAEVAER